MKAYIWKTGLKIRPFHDPVGDSLVVNRPLRDHQQETLSSHGFEVCETDDPTAIQDSEYVLVRDHLFFSKKAFARFWKKAKASCTSGACALEKGPFTEFTGFIQDLRTETVQESGKEVVFYDLFYVNNQIPERSVPLDRLPPILIEAKQHTYTVEPGQVMPASVDVHFEAAYTDATLMHIHNWVHLWMVNLMALGNTLLDSFLGSKLRFLFRALSAFSLNKHKIADRIVVKGKKCDIHPTAIVQGSILGDRVKVGPYAVVQGSVLGDDVRLPEHTIIMGSVMGKGTSTCCRGVLKLCVLYPGASGGKMQGCLIGRDSFVADFSFHLDIKLQGTIRVYHEGKFVDTGLSFLGSCIGHETNMGPGIWLSSGREIPNRSTVVKNPSSIISSISPDLPEGEWLTIRDGALVRIKELFLPKGGETKEKKQLPEPSETDPSKPDS